jgi:hypothetical protein
MKRCSQYGVWFTALVVHGQDAIEPRAVLAVMSSNLLGERPSSKRLLDYISSLSTSESTIPEVKSYHDAVYFNYYFLGLSLLFSPKSGYKPDTGLKREDLRDDDLILDSIDIYNVPKPISSLSGGGAKLPRLAELAFSTYPISPLVLSLATQTFPKEGETTTTRPSSFDVFPTTSGKDFVAALGEPDRKGGGAGPSSGSIGIWCEWSKDGIMVEFGGDDARGPQAWERGKDAVWRVITLFTPKST